MSLFEKINQDIKSAMLAKEKEKLEVLRAIKSAFLLEKTSKAGDSMDEARELQIIQKLAKQRKDAADIYSTQNREDLASKELAEVEIMSVYLPAQMSQTELEEVLKGIISKVGATSPSDMGKVMGIASKQLGGKADGKVIASTVRSLLA